MAAALISVYENFFRFPLQNLLMSKRRKSSNSSLINFVSCNIQPLNLLCYFISTFESEGNWKLFQQLRSAHSVKLSTCTMFVMFAFQKLSLLFSVVKDVNFFLTSLSISMHERMWRSLFRNKKNCIVVDDVKRNSLNETSKLLPEAKRNPLKKLTRLEECHAIHAFQQKSFNSLLLFLSSPLPPRNRQSWTFLISRQSEVQKCILPLNWMLCRTKNI